MIKKLLDICVFNIWLCFHAECSELHKHLNLFFRANQLPVPRPCPPNRWCLPACLPACQTDLLEVRSEAMHVLVVGQHGVGLGLKEVDVPDAQKSQQDRHILVQRSAMEVVVLVEGGGSNSG